MDASARMWGGVVPQGRRALVGIGLLLSIAIPGLVCAQGQTTVTEELRAMYRADQSDREFTSPPTAEDWAGISSRDAERLRRVHELLKGNNLSIAEDFYHAAMILQHGDESEDVLLAHILSTAAGFMGDERGYWLSAASLDRYLLRTRMPQRLGTQYFPPSVEDPFEIDESQQVGQGPYVRWLPDAIRQIYGVRTLAEQAERVRAINRDRGR